MKLPFRRKKLNRRSIKEAADTLPAGICYFSESGVVKLCNRQMFRLYHAMAQRDLQNLTELTDALSACNAQTAVVRLSESGQTYLFPDGKVWKYTESAVTARDGNTYTEVLFSDVTELHERHLELKKQIQKLKQMNRKIRELSENAAAATKEREILAAKTELHAQMGENLTMLRQILAVPTPRKTQDAAVQAMRRTVHFLMADSEETGKDSGFEEFLQTAANSGVTVQLEGTLPERQALREVLIIAMRECLTNSVRHGEADRLHIALSEEEGNVVCKITNNGTVPKTEIIPHGGLRNLLRHVENCGGKMMICTAQVFTLTVVLPDREEEKT